MNVFGLISAGEHVVKGWLRLMMHRDVESPGESDAPGRRSVALALALWGD